MKLSNIRLTALAALVSAYPAYSVDVCAYANRNCVGTTFGCCTNVPAGACCFWQFDILGVSVQFRNLTGRWIGNTYLDTVCGVQDGTIAGDASVPSACLSVPTTSTGRWVSGRHVINGTVVAPSAKTGSVPAECRGIDVLGFTYSNKEYRVDVQEGQLENVVRLLQAEDYEALVRAGAREA